MCAQWLPIRNMFLGETDTVDSMKTKYTNGLCVTIKDSEVTVQDTTIAKPDQAAYRLCDKLDNGEMVHGKKSSASWDVSQPLS